MKNYIILLLGMTFFFRHSHVYAQEKEHNPITQEWLAENLSKALPRLIFTAETEQLLRKKLDSDPLTKQFYVALKESADQLLEEEPLTRQKRGRRLLMVSRRAIQRTLTLALVYRVSKENRYLERLETELQALSRFSDWNPSHFLDVAEMAVALALPYDWCKDDLSEETKELLRNALIEKALKASIAARQANWWHTAHHNWNLVCHGGLAVASLAIYEDEPDLASHVLRRSIELIPLGLEPYAPDGIYPEGPSYWGYATNYLTLTISALESAVDTDFGFTNAKGILESALYSQITAGHSGDYFNFFDASENGFHDLKHFGLLSWFAPRTQQEVDKEAFAKAFEIPAKEEKVYSRFAALYLLNLAKVPNDLPNVKLPQVWTGMGDSPLGVIRSENENGIYLAAKGGRAADNHGNMDAGSFILEWQKIRWSVDPGNQDYHTLEEIMGNGQLWNKKQNSRRWELLTKNNFGHSTLTVNGEPHLVEGRALLTEEQLEDPQPYFTFDLTPVFGDQLHEVKRTFKKVSNEAIQVTDDLIFSPNTKTLAWQFMTQAAVKVGKKAIQLKQDGHQLEIMVESPLSYDIRVVSLSPPPLEYDKNIPELQRIEIIVDRSSFTGDQGSITVTLSGKK